MPISPARQAAFEILRRVEDENSYASNLLANVDERLRVDDRALCHQLVLGVLRRQLWLDRVIEHFANRKIESLDLPVRLALRLGLYQLRYLSRIPASAAVNESVNLVRVARLRSAAPFTNAVLRQATRDENYDPASEVTDPLEKLAIETSHPRWLIERWVNAWGQAEASALARANNEPAPVAFRLTSKTIGNGKGQRVVDDLVAAGALLQNSQLTPDSWRLTGPGTALLRELVGSGQIYLQDEASQLVAHLVTAQTFDRGLDLCAAPGSKATLIAALAPQALMVAVDIYEHRLHTLLELAAIQGNESIQAVTADATGELPFAKDSFDCVLVDAPCSGTGTLRRNPEIRWRLAPAEITELAKKQTRILTNAAEMVRPGGRLFYSTCSLEIEENEGVAEGFLNSRNEFEQLSLTSTQISSSLDLATTTGALRTWPHRQDVDGFCIFAFRRRA